MESKIQFRPPELFIGHKPRSAEETNPRLMTIHGEACGYICRYGKLNHLMMWLLFSNYYVKVFNFVSLFEGLFVFVCLALRFLQ